MTRAEAKWAIENPETLKAMAEGKDIECRILPVTSLDDWEVIQGDSLNVSRTDLEFRIKPTPKLRPWKPEEVPVGSVVIHKENTTIRRVIGAVDDGTVCLGGLGCIGFDSVLEHYKLADGKPCGVEEP